MNDRELLERAAKAAGIAVRFVSEDSAYDPGACFRVDEEEATDWWNPLTDDGDALRLAVKLGIDLSLEGRVIRAWCKKRASFLSQESGNDPCAATRRAIVRAAAAMVEA